MERKPNVLRGPAYIPYCPVHHVAMGDYSRRELVIFFKCPVEGCDCTDKSPRVNFYPSAGNGNHRNTDR